MSDIYTETDRDCDIQLVGNIINLSRTESILLEDALYSLQRALHTTGYDNAVVEVHSDKVFVVNPKGDKYRVAVEDVWKCFY